MVKYVIGFRFGKTDQRFIREYYGAITNMEDWRPPTLSQQKHLVKSEQVFETEQDAKAAIKKLNGDATKALQAHKNKKGYVHRDCWHYNQRRTFKRFADSTRYSVEKYEPDFVFKKERRSGKRCWVKDNSANKFCHVCGMNMVADQYLQVGQSRICPFCIKHLSEDADKAIEKLKEENPDIVDHHMNATFLENLE